MILAFILWEACENDESMAIPSTLTLTHRSANEVAGKMAKKGVEKEDTCLQDSCLSSALSF